MATNLLPCSSCGSATAPMVLMKGSWIGHSFQVCCDPSERGGCGLETICFRTEAEAIARWNTRVESEAEKTYNRIKNSIAMRRVLHLLPTCADRDVVRDIYLSHFSEIERLTRERDLAIKELSETSRKYGFELGQQQAEIAKLKAALYRIRLMASTNDVSKRISNLVIETLKGDKE